MERVGRFAGTWRWLTTQWPMVTAVYAILLLLLLFIGVSAEMGWWGLIPLCLGLFFLLAYWLGAQIWVAHRLYDPTGWQPHHLLFDMGQLRDTDSFAFIDLDGRHLAMSLGRRLTTGRVVVIDVYNPQLTPGAALVRGRAHTLHPPTDPRFMWRNGRFDLLPLPNNSVRAVFLLEVLSAFWQAGDREALLREIHRVLIPGGHLLMSERTRSRTNWLIFGPAAINLVPWPEWRTLLQRVGFSLNREKDLGGVLHCIRADKPIPQEGRQLRLELNL